MFFTLAVAVLARRRRLLHAQSLWPTGKQCSSNCFSRWPLLFLHVAADCCMRSPSGQHEKQCSSRCFSRWPLLFLHVAADCCMRSPSGQRENNALADVFHVGRCCSCTSRQARDAQRRGFVHSYSYERILFPSIVTAISVRWSVRIWAMRHHAVLHWCLFV
jgi:hypothetical protein